MPAAEPTTRQLLEAVPSARVVVERPPPGLARGKYAAPAWAIAVLGGTLVVLGVAYLIWRFLGLRHR
jgi:hypothetical protein